ncbi:major facilitator superfamily protein [Sarocladium implicatum]|nr:major facilitator superfamily protein [Sarocladium implicatum]
MAISKDEADAHAGSPLAREPSIPEKVQQAIDEGHDADIPSSQGYVTSTMNDKASVASHGRRSHGTNRSIKDVEKDAEKSETVESSDDENIVWWESEDDPQNPYNWASWRKVLNCVLVSALCFVTPLASSMFAPGVPDLLREFEVSSRELATFCVSVYVLGFAAGPMLFAPLSEIYGRSIVYHVTNVGFITFLVACALAPSMSTFIAFRFFSGVFGACPLTNGGGTIADLIRQEKRGAAMAGFAMGPLMGPIIGPVAGGFVTDSLGWRWTFWILAITSGTLSTLFFIFSRETYAPIILQRRVDKMKKETGNELLRSKLDPGLTPRDYFIRGIVRPMKMILFSPICIFAGVYVALTYGYLYLMFSTITPLFMQIYGFSVIEAGLSFLGLGVGSMAGVIFFSITSDRYIKKKAKEEDERATAEGREQEGMKPEYRLPPLKFGAFLLPAGLFIYGWTAEKQVHWIAPIIGTAIVGVGNLLIFMALQLYLVDSFTLYSASALAANTVTRSIVGAILPLAAFPMFDNLGVGWGNSLLGFIAVLFLPAPWLILRYGEFLRKKYEIKDL